MAVEVLVGVKEDAQPQAFLRFSWNFEGIDNT